MRDCTLAATLASCKPVLGTMSIASDAGISAYNQWHATCKTIADQIAVTNPNFNRLLFLRRCGVAY
jgi:hypothetical protein